MAGSWNIESPRSTQLMFVATKIGMFIFILSNLFGSTIQITTLPLPVLSTLQAVRPSKWTIKSVLIDGILVWLGLQLHMRHPHSWRTLHKMVIWGNSPCLRRSSPHCHLRSHRRASAQPRSTTRAPRKTSIHILDDRPGNPSCRHHHRRESTEAHEPADNEQPPNASV